MVGRQPVAAPDLAERVREALADDPGGLSHGAPAEGGADGPADGPEDAVPVVTVREVP